MEAATSVIAVVQLSAQVFQLCSNYYIGVKNARDDISRLHTEVISIYDVLTSVKDTVDTPDPTGTATATVDILSRPGGPIDCCKEELQRLEVKLDHGGMGKYGKRAFKWPLQSKDVDKSIMVFERVKTLLNTALATDQTKSMRHFGDTLNELKQLVVETRSEIASTNTRDAGNILKASHDDFIAWLQAPDVSNAHESASKKHLQSTGEWFTKGSDFERWKSTRGDFLVLYGMPGCGKTVMSSAVIDIVQGYCSSRQKTAYAYFYFDFADVKRQSTINFLSSILAQLVGPNLELSELLQAVQSKRVKYGQRPATRDLKEMLFECARFNELTDIYIVVDALDECPLNAASQQRLDLLALLQDLGSLPSSNIHLFATSRPESDIEAWWQSLPSVRAIPINVDSIDVDISRHISNRLSMDEKLNKWPPHVKAEIEQELTSSAKGMFRWVQCHLDELRSRKTTKTLRAALHSLPKDLDQTYERIINNIDEEYAHHAHRALIWLSYSVRPLTLTEVAEAAVFVPSQDFDADERLREPAALLEILGSLVTVTSITANPKQVPEMVVNQQNQSDCMQLAHFTVKEYLISERLRTANLRSFHITVDASEVFLTTACVRYLHLLGALKETMDNNYFDRYPLWLYAARYFSTHLRKISADCRGKVEDCLVSFIKSADAVKSLCSDTSLVGRLVFATENSMVPSIHAMLEEGADINGYPTSSDPEIPARTALAIAVSDGDPEIVSILLEQGAGPNSLDRGGHVLYTAVSNVMQDGLVEEYRQAWSDQMGIVRLLLDAGADVNGANSEGESVLNAALSLPSMELFQLLLDRGADPNSRDFEGEVTLWEAYHNFGSDSRPFELLLKYGADTNIPGQDGEYLLGKSIMKERGDDTRLTRLFLKHGAEFARIKVPDVLESVTSDDDTSLLQLLLDHDNDPNHADADDKSLLGHAIVAGNQNALKVLLSKDANPNTPFVHAEKTWVALDYLLEHGPEVCAKLLLRYGAKISLDLP